MVPANHCTETRRRSTRALVPPSTDSGGSLPSSMASVRLDRYAPCDRDGLKLAVPCALRSRVGGRNRDIPVVVSRPWNQARTMPVGPWPVNDGAATRLEEAAVRIAPRCVHPSNEPQGRTMNMASVRHGNAYIPTSKRLKRHYFGGGGRGASAGTGEIRSDKVGPFRLTMLRVQAYIQPLGAPSATRCDGAPLKLITGTVKKHPTVIGCVGLRRLPGFPGVGAARLPRCLKSESEERETWTAGSLRAVSSRGEIHAEGGFGRDF